MNFRCTILGILEFFALRFFCLFTVGLRGLDVIRNEGEYVLDVIAQGFWAHTIGGGAQRFCKDFPLLDYWLLAFPNECSQPHIV